MKNITKFLLATFFLSLGYISRGQTYIGPKDSCGYLDKEYDSTIVYYVVHVGKTSHGVYFMNIHDSSSKHTYSRMPITLNEVQKLLHLHKKSARKLKWSRIWGYAMCTSACLIPGSLIAYILENNNTLIHKSYKNYSICSYVALASLAAGLTFEILAGKEWTKAIAAYNLATVQKNMGSNSK